MARRPAFLSVLAEILVLVGLFSALTFAFFNVFVPPPAIGQQDAALAAIPAQVGDRWVYAYESKSDSGGKSLHIAHWTSEESVTAIIDIPEGQVVLRTAQYQGDYKGNLTYASSYSDGDYLIDDGCIYFLQDAWANGGLKPTYLEELNHGEISPGLCFPLMDRKQWGTSDVPWRVIGVDDSPPSFLPQSFRNAIRVSTNHCGSGGLLDVWFERGVGIVAERYFHGGTYEEDTKILQRFIPVN